MKSTNVSVESVFALTVGVLMTVGLTGCLGDKTTDDWRADQVQQKKAMVQPILGTYSGTLVSTQDNLSMGSMSVSIVADDVAQTNYNNLGTEFQSSLRGTLIYSGVTTAQVPFTAAAYDEKTGVFNTTITIKDTSGASIPLILKGTIGQNQFTGNIYAQGFDNYSGSFALTKGATIPSQTVAAKSMNSARSKMFATTGQIFSGMYGSSTPVTLSMVYSDTQSDQRFLNVFYPKTPLTVNMIFPRAGKQNLFNFSSSAAVFDESTNQLKAYQDVTDSSAGSTFRLTLECVRTISGNVTLAWDCVFTDGDSGKTNIHFTPN